ncbi:MAG: 2-succinyl-5-enolpyruvyl-6-hydroxy-3-cyclohexene-1-carboxylate synthase, partial [Proteobacteria bacterium]
MNIEWSKKILIDLAETGVEEFVFCAGARNSPLVMALDRAKGIKAYSFFEERSASFFALGLARASGRPVAVITTSGTAAAELLPATIEAFHTGVPLILVTADRPRRLRGTGAPQAIDQTGLYAKFVAAEFDLELGGEFELGEWQKRAPVHINICFDEPLIDGTLEEFHIGTSYEDTFVGSSRCTSTTSAEWASVRLARFMKMPGDLMVLVGTLESNRERATVSTFLRELGAPVYLEATSGLREDQSLGMIALRSGDKILPKALKDYGIKRVLRLGGVP